MGKNIGELFVTLGLDTSKLKSGLSNAERALKNVGLKISSVGKSTNSELTPALRKASGAANKTSSAFGSLTKKLIALGGAYVGLRGLSRLAGSFMDVASSTEQYRLRLETLLGSQEAATEAMEFFRKTAAKVPFTLQEVIESGTTLTAMGADLQQWTPILTDLAAVMGMKLPEAASALGRAFAGGAGAADIFRERGILQIIKDFARMKYGIEDITKVSLPEFRRIMYEAFTDPEGKIAGAADKLSTTWAGTVSMLQDKWFQFREAVMKAGVFDYLKERLSAFNEKLDQLIKTGKLQEWAEGAATAIMNLFEAMEQIGKIAIPVVEKGLKAVNFWAQRVRDVSWGVQSAWLKMKYSGEELDRKLWELHATIYGGQAVVGGYDRNLEDMEKAAKKNKEEHGKLNSTLKQTTTLLVTQINATNSLVVGYDGVIPVVENLVNVLKKAQATLKDGFLETAIPGARNFKDIIEKVPESLENLSYETEETTQSIKNYFDGLYNDIATGWANTIQSWLEGTKTFKEFLSGLWEDIKKSFFRVIGEMVAEWSVNFIKNLISGATSAASSITSSLGSSITTMANAVKGVGKSVGFLLVSLSKAIATSAKILANAAGAILKVGAVAVALYAAFKLVGGVIDKLLGKGKKGGNEYITKLLEEQNWVYLTVINEKLDDVNKKIAGMWSEFGVKVDHVNQKLGYIRGLLKEISNNTSLLRKLKSAQTGINTTVTQPTLFVAGERGPERIAVTPTSQPASPNLTVNLQVSALDAQSFRDFINKGGGREIKNWVQYLFDTNRLRVRMTNISG